MASHIIVAHGMRRGQENDKLTEFMTNMLDEDRFDFKLAFLESEQQDLRSIMLNMIEAGESHFNIIPLLIFSAMHYSYDIPNIVHNIKQQYPNITVSIGKPLGTHPLMVELIEHRINDELLPNSQHLHSTGVVVIAHGNINGKFPQAHEELQCLVSQLNIPHHCFARTLYGELKFHQDIDHLARDYERLIIVPLFLYDGRLVNKLKRQLQDMNLPNQYLITQSINFNPILKEIIYEQMTVTTVTS